MKYTYVILSLLFLSCTKNKFYLPIGYNITFNADGLRNSYKFEDSVTQNYDSINVLKHPFKAMGEYYLLKKDINDEDSIFKLYQNAIPFKVRKILNDNSQVIEINYYLMKNYNAKLYNKNRDYPNKKLISYEEVFSQYGIMLNKNEYFKLDEKESTFKTFNYLKIAFIKKYGNYNLHITNLYNFDGLPAKTLDLIWFYNGVKIKLSFQDSQEDKWFEFDYNSNELYSDYYIQYKLTAINISFQDLNGIKKMRKSEELKKKLDEEKEFQIENQKRALENRKLNNEKRKIDSCSQIKANLILEKM